MTRMTVKEEMAAVHAVYARLDRPQTYLLQAFTEGRYAAQVGYNVHNPYGGAMAEAWEKGRVSAGRGP